MKKKIAVLLIVAVMVFSLAMPGFAEFDAKANRQLRIKQYRDPTEICFYGISGTYYEITTAVEYVGYNHITVGDEVKVCQAYTKATGYNPNGIDGIWGNNSESALRGAQTFMHDYGYTPVTSDGVCGKLTWHGFYSYHYDTGYIDKIPYAVKAPL